MSTAILPRAVILTAALVLGLGARIPPPSPLAKPIAPPPTQDPLVELSAWAAMIQALTGVATLVAAIVAARYAARAADEARRSADAARASLDGFIASERGVLKFNFANAHDQPDDYHVRGYKVHFRNQGRGNAEVVAVAWAELAGPMWPRELRFEQYGGPYVQAGTDNHITLGSNEGMPELPIWLAGRVRYRTLVGSEFASHFVYKVSEQPSDGFNIWPITIRPDVCADMPVDT